MSKGMRQKRRKLRIQKYGYRDPETNKVIWPRIGEETIAAPMTIRTQRIEKAREAIVYGQRGRAMWIYYQLKEVAPAPLP